MPSQNCILAGQTPRMRIWPAKLANKTAVFMLHIETQTPYMDRGWKHQYMLTEIDRHTHTPAPLWGQWLVEQWHSAQEQSSLFGEDDSAQEQHQTGSLSPQSFSHQLAFEHQLGSPGAWCKGQKGNIGDGAYSFCVCFLCHSLCRLAIQDPLELCELTLIQGVLARLLQQALHALDFSSHLAKGTSLCNSI